MKKFYLSLFSARQNFWHFPLSLKDVFKYGDPPVFNHWKKLVQKVLLNIKHTKVF